MDQLLAIRAFARVVEAGNFTRAANSLDMPNATLSKLVQELEAHLGVRLLQRTTRRVTVTAEGRDYYERALRIVRDLEDIDCAFNSVTAKPRGQLRMDIGGSTARDVLRRRCPICRPVSRYHLDLGVSDRTVDLISDNVDCVVRRSAERFVTGGTALRQCANDHLCHARLSADLRHSGVSAGAEQWPPHHQLSVAAERRAFPRAFAMVKSESRSRPRTALAS